MATKDISPRTRTKDSAHQLAGESCLSQRLPTPSVAQSSLGGVCRVTVNSSMNPGNRGWGQERVGPQPCPSLPAPPRLGPPSGQPGDQREARPIQGRDEAPFCWVLIQNEVSLASSSAHPHTPGPLL